jgi:outer membrane receptor protein involved in Fe transport
LQFSDQLNAKNLLTFQTSYTTASTLRDNNTTNFGTSSRITKRSVGGILVDSSNPLNGICYAPGGGATLPCYNATGSDINRNIGGFTLRSAFNGTVVPASGTCGGGPCQYLVANDGSYGKYNTVKPRFYAASLQDNFKPTDRLSFDLGIRFDRYEFLGADTTGTPARAFFYNAWNRQFPTLQQINVPSQVEGYSEWEPRFGMTYTVDPRTVLRASYGRYAEAPNAAFEQYNFLNQSAPIDLAPFVRLGVGNTPAHAIRPEVSNNYDFSFEHQFGRDTSVKITPFLRKTQDQIEQFYLDQKTNFVSGLNVGRQTSQGVEFELDKGDFSRNGLAARVTFTYTNSYIQYNRESNGKSIVDGINADIAGYNALTKAGGGAPCYTTTGTASPACAAGSIANPYYNAPIQALIDPNGRFTTYDFFPAAVGAGGYSSYGAPYIATAILQYKHGPLAITPAIQFSGGQRYGVPESNPGIDPTSCTKGLVGTTAGDPRYPYGAVGGLPVDAANCGTLAAIPDIYTGRFDGVGAFVAPSNLALHTQVTYDLNKRITLVANFANIVSRCFGGTAVPFAVNHACQYGATYGAGSGPISVGNVFNPGDNIQPFLRTPYDPLFLTAPFQMFFEARIKI